MADLPAAAYLGDAIRTQQQIEDALEAWLGATKELPGAGGAWPTLTIAGGAIAPTIGHGWVDTEAGGATDDLATIGQATLGDGRLLLLRSKASARVVTVKHAAGGVGQIAIADAADLVLTDPSMALLLRRNGAQWDEVGRFWGSQHAAFRARYGLASLTAVSTFTARQDWARGVDLAVSGGGVLTLGTDGNYFHVTNATNIVQITTSPLAGPGTVVTLVFDGTLALVHDATKLLLTGESNAQMTPGTSITLVHEGAGIWRETGSRGGGATVFDPVATNAAVENTAVEGTLYSGVLPGGALGTRGRMRFEPLLASLETDQLLSPVVQRNLTLRLKLNGTTIWSRVFGVRRESEAGVLTRGLVSRLAVVLCADGSHTAQVGLVQFKGTEATAVGVSTAIDEDTQVTGAANAAAAVTVSLTAQFSVAGTAVRPATVTCYHALLEVLRAT